VRELLHDAAERSIRYREALNERAVAPTTAAIDGLSALGGPLPDAPTDATEVLRLLDEYGSPATTASAGGRFFGFVVGGSLPAALAANWLTSAWDQNAGLVALGHGAAEMERVSLEWLIDLLGLPAATGGGFVTGATMANFSGLAAARHAVLARAGWDVEAKGLFGAPEITVVVGEEVHPSITKALTMLGMGRERVVRVPVDAQGRMVASALPPINGPTIVCAQAGNVNTGAIDPLREICGAAKDAGAWVHIDGAFGLWAAAAPGYRHLIDGHELADSWSTDAHKWLNVPYDCGLVFVRNAADLTAPMGVTAAYLSTQDERVPSYFTPELSRRARGVEVWAALRSLGRAGVAELIETTCRHARRFAEGLRGAGYEVLNDVVLNQVLVSFGSAEVTQRVIAAIQEDGTCWCGGTVWQGQSAMRISVSSWATTEDDVELSLQAMLRSAASVRAVSGAS
jgi:glutamate/tyrosine decarboxylase-like PLP-dependent enzyme